MTYGPIHHFKPSDQYNRLLTAFGLEQTTENDRTHFTTLSDCIRRGYVTGPVLEAARTKGINPDYIRTGALPVRIDETGQE